MEYTYFIQLDNSAKTGYKVNKLNLINRDDCPYKFPAAVWKKRSMQMTTTPVR